MYSILSRKNNCSKKRWGTGAGSVYGPELFWILGGTLGGVYPIEISPLISTGSQLTCFYMIETSVMKELVETFGIWKVS